MRRIWRLIGMPRWPTHVASAADTSLAAFSADTFFAAFSAVHENEFFCERVFFSLDVFFRFVADRLIEILRPQQVQRF